MSSTQKIIKENFKDPFHEVDQSQEILQALRDFRQKPQGFFLLSGTNGTGKTFAAEALLYSLPFNSDLDANVEFQAPMKKMISQAQLNIEWQKSIAEWSSTAWLLNHFVYTKALVLDDIGTRTPTDAFMDFLYALIDARYTNRNTCATIITTNLNAADMRKRFGDAFLSRVGSGKCYRLDGIDRRRNEGKYQQEKKIEEIIF